MSLQYEHTFRQIRDQITESLFDDVERLSVQFAQSFPEKGNTQMSQFARLATTTTLFGDLIAFVKRQVGKRDATWRTEVDGQMIGDLALAFLEKIRTKAQQSFDESQKQQNNPLQEEDLNRLRLAVAAICLRNLQSAYMYEKIKRGIE